MSDRGLDDKGSITDNIFLRHYGVKTGSGEYILVRISSKWPPNNVHNNLLLMNSSLLIVDMIPLWKEKPIIMMIGFPISI